MRLVHRHVLQRDDALARLDLLHAVDHQERVALRQVLEDLVDVHLSHLFSPAFGLPRSAVRSCAALRRQASCSSNGIEAGVGAGLGERARDQRAGRDVHVIADRDVAVDHGGAADACMAADVGAAGDADAARDRGVRADAHVVADLDLVVELHALLDHRVVERAAVDRGVGADLDVVADAHARRSAGSSPSGPPSGAMPKPSAPITTPECRTHALADRAARVDDHARIQAALVADGHVVADHAARADRTTRLAKLAHVARHHVPSGWTPACLAGRRN